MRLGRRPATRMKEYRKGLILLRDPKGVCSGRDRRVRGCVWYDRLPSSEEERTARGRLKARLRICPVVGGCWYLHHTVSPAKVPELEGLSGKQFVDSGFLLSVPSVSSMYLVVVMFLLFYVDPVETSRLKSGPRYQRLRR